MSNSVICDKLLDVLETIEIVQKRTKSVSTPDDFTINDDALILFDSVLMRLQTIGETLKSIEKSDREFFTQFADFDIESAIKFRDIISHHYADINPNIVFDICKNHLENCRRK